MSFVRKINMSKDPVFHVYRTKSQTAYSGVNGEAGFLIFYYIFLILNDPEEGFLQMKDILENKMLRFPTSSKTKFIILARFNFSSANIFYSVMSILLLFGCELLLTSSQEDN